MGLSSSKTKTTTNQTTTPTVPDWIQGPYKNYASMVNDFAGMAPQVTPASALQQKAFDLSANGGPVNSVANISRYMNPYTSQVINAGVNDLNRARNIAISDNSSAATGAAGAGAFTGSRAGVADAETNRGYLDQVANMTANLRNQGWNNAVSASQSDIAAEQQRIRDMANLGETQFQINQDANPYNVKAKQLATLAQLLQGMDGQMFTGSNTQGTTTSKTSGGGLGQILGGLGSLAMGLGTGGLGLFGTAATAAGGLAGHSRAGF